MQLTLILLVVAFCFLVKSVVGFGGPLLGVPMLAPFLGVEHAVVVLSLGNLVANLMLLWDNRAGASDVRRLLVRLIAAGTVGVAAGSYLLTTLDDRVLSIGLAISVVAYIVLALTKPDLHLSRETGMRVAVPVGVFGGFIHGATGNSGTIFGTFLHSLAMPRKQFVFAVTIPFLVFGSIQIIALAGLGAFGRDRVVEALLAIIPVVVVTPFGSRIGGRLAGRTFSYLVLGLLGFAGLVLLVTAIRG